MKPIVFIIFLLSTSLNAQNNTLLNAIRSGNIATVDSILSDCNCINETSNKYFNWTALHEAVKSGNITITKSLIRKGANINAVHDNFGTPLMYATELGELKIIKLLISSGASLMLRNSNGYSLVQNIPISGNMDVLKYYQSLNIDLKDKALKDGWTIMITAAGDGTLEMFKYLVETMKFPTDDKTIDNYSEFLAAVNNSNAPIVKYLLEKGANPNEKNMLGESALIIASKEGSSEVSSLLLHKGADKNITVEYMGDSVSYKAIDFAKTDSLRSILK